MSYYFMSDIHGNDQAMMGLLEKEMIDYNRDHLIIGGDLIDRGKGSGSVLKQLKQLQETYPNNVHILIGNHEEMMDWYLKEKSSMWLLHGGKQSLESFEEVFSSNEETDEHLSWLLKRPLIYQTESFLFTHAGLEFDLDSNSQTRNILWTTKEELYAYSTNSIQQLIGNRKIVHGHTAGEKVTDDGFRVSCDLGCEVWEDGELALVNLTEGSYKSYSTKTKQISTHRIQQISA